ncbi:MAG: hypothetical protein JSR41_04740 [Proteobacteria bacterium]|nr:hypothetical protein [Pseudomonadota bacterium]
MPQGKRKVLEELLGRSIRALTEQDAEQFILVRLKQLAVNLLSEFIDECLDGHPDHPIVTGMLWNQREVEKFFSTLPPGDFEDDQSFSAQIVGGLISMIIEGSGYGATFWQWAKAQPEG